MARLDDTCIGWILAFLVWIVCGSVSVAYDADHVLAAILYRIYPSIQDALRNSGRLCHAPILLIVWGAWISVGTWYTGRYN